MNTYKTRNIHLNTQIYITMIPEATYFFDMLNLDIKNSGELKK